MREFDLEAAKAGAAVQTRGGLEARVIAFDCLGNLPVIALVKQRQPYQGSSREETCHYHANGRVFARKESDYDLVMKPKTQEVWVVIRISGGYVSMIATPVLCRSEDAAQDYLARSGFNPDDFRIIPVTVEI